MIVVHVRNSVSFILRLCGILLKIVFCVSVKQYVDIINLKPILKFGTGLM